MKSKQRLGMNLRAPHVAAVMVQCAVVVAFWLLASFRTTSLVFAGAETPVPERQLAWGLTAVGFFAMLLAWLGTRDSLRRRGRTLLLTWAAIVVVVLGALGAEAGLPSAAALGLTTAWIAARGPRRLNRWMEAHRWVSVPLIALLCVELFLQVVSALVAHELASLEPTESRADLRVLCIGDSFTYGIGASDRDHAWPGALQAKLRAALPGRSVDVINAGLPGQNSSTCLKHLVERMATVHPQIVLVCCGANNRWNLADMPLASTQVASRSEQWELVMRKAALHVRLYRAWVLLGFRFDEPAEPAPPVIETVVSTTLSPAALERDIPHWEARVKEDPTDGPAWCGLADAYFRTGRFEDAIAASRTAQQYTPADPRIWYARVHSYIAMGSTELAFQACTEMLRAGCDSERFFDALSSTLHFDDSLVQQHLDFLKRNQPDLYRRLPPLPDDYFRRRLYVNVLHDDLRRMHALCREQRAALVLHNYPLLPGDSDPLAIAARQMGCEFVNHWPPFAERLKTVPRHRLYVADEHCTDEGYALMAEDLLPVVLKLAPSTPARETNP